MTRKTAAATIAIALLIAACSAVAQNGGIHMDDAPTITLATEEVHDEAEGAHDEEGMEMEASTVSVSLTEFGMSPSEITVAAGDMVTFEVTNDGMIEHEFEVTGSGDAEHEHEGAHGEASETKLVLAPGESGELTVMFDGSQDEIACLLPGHYEAGMLMLVNYTG